jgi:uncharacterized membrane protein
MPRSAPLLNDEKLEQMLGNLLRAGVMISGAVVLAGGVLYLLRHGSAVPHYRVFSGEPSDLRHVRGIVSDALDLRDRGLIQFGLLLLVATPVARVLSSLVGFAIQRDRTYVAVTLIVLAVLIYGLAGGPM